MNWLRESGSRPKYVVKPKAKKTKKALEKFIKSVGTLVKAQPISRNSGREGSEATASAVRA